MTTRTPLIVALAATLALAGCKKENHTIVAGPDTGEPDANLAANGPVALPPSVTKSATYRCADNKVVFVDWLSDGKSANIRTDKAGTPVQVSAPAAGSEMTGPGGYSLSGSPSDSTAKIAVPGHSAQSCKA